MAAEAGRVLLWVGKYVHVTTGWDPEGPIAGERAKREGNRCQWTCRPSSGSSGRS